MRTKILLASLALSIGTLSAQNYQVPVSEKNEPMMKGKFQPTWNSLENYQVPEWFRNAKFGIWAHWGPQCVEGSGDWMARSMYLEGSAEYKHHVEHYGHPSEVGFKDIIPLFKENILSIMFFSLTSLVFLNLVLENIIYLLVVMVSNTDRSIFFKP